MCRSAPWAHPRSRGENLRRSAVEALATGSSPLTRGKHCARRYHRPCSGLIPAHAGKTTLWSTPGRCAGAHPRSRGENLYVDVVPSMKGGSSPLTRGKLLHRGGHSDVDGLIPAHAGKTRTSTVSPSVAGAHPRSRGENSSGNFAPGSFVGSSPLTRGKHLSAVVQGEGERLIPAHAGKTQAGGGVCSARRAHPRSRGENSSAARNRRVPSGSSPLTRGKLEGVSVAGERAGLIPAHAGKTHLHYTSRAVYRAHPRSRGENCCASPPWLGAWGSSPLTRGKPREGRIRPHGVGLIPAHAGKTPPPAGEAGSSRAHPRSRGENQR